MNNVGLLGDKCLGLGKGVGGGTCQANVLLFEIERTKNKSH